MSSQSKRLETLKKRFEKPSRLASETSTNARKRHSVYIDEALMQRVDEMYKEVKHQLYPTEVTKSAFLEQLLALGLESIDEVKAALTV